MESKKILLILSFLIFVGLSHQLSGQCTYSISLEDTYGDGWNGASVTVNVAGTIVLSSVTLSSGYGPTNYDFTANTGQSITVTFNSGSWNSECYYTVYNGPNGTGTVIFASSYGSAPPSSQTITSCGGTVTPPANTCLAAAPFCTSNSYTFPASTNVPDMGAVGCLSTTPNPAWYWMQIGTPGSIDIYMTSGGDVDFIAWGPFTSLSAACASNLMANSGVDCSYSTAAQETANITSAQAGEVYVLLITNYANMVTNISFSQTGGAGSTNCGIIAPPIVNNGPLCVGQTLNLTVSSPTTGATYSWTGPNGFTSNTMNPSIPNITTANAGVYSLVITVGAQVSPAVTTTVAINSLPNVTASANPTSVCSGVASSLTASGATTYSWSGGTITGSTLNPVSVTPSSTTTYTVTGTSSGCSNTGTVTVSINPTITPTFTALGPYCYGTAVGPLPTTSTNGISGSWSPAINNTVTTTYTFTPNAGQCATTTSMTITIIMKTAPLFNPLGPFCSGASFGPLPTTSTNGITGTWTPAINNTATTTYTFTPDANLCASPTSMTIVVNSNISPSFTALGPFCSGASFGPLPTTSTNGITGTWSPAINNTATTLYTFTPTAGQCAIATTMTITVNANITPTFASVGPYCSGAGIGALPTTSTNGITGSWSPAINNTATTLYTFTPTAGLCAPSTTMTITINPNITPTFTAMGPYCSGAAVGSLPTTSTNGITGTWSPAINNTTTTTYTFTPTAGLCATTTTMTITINPNITPTFTAVGPYCFGTNFGPLPTTSNNGIIGNWSPAINNTVTTTYTFTPSAGQCALNTTMTIEVNVLSTNITSLVPQQCEIFGSATVNAYGGDAPHTYFWPTNAGGVSGNTATSLVAGLYVVTVTDAIGCSITQNVTITGGGPLTATSVLVSNLQCYGDTDGRIDVTIVGGTPNFTVNWGTSYTTTPSHNCTINGLGGGTFNITVTDVNDCQDITSVIITEPSLLLANSSASSVLCNGGISTITVTAVGGTTPYSGTGTFTGTAGTHSYTLTDSNGCIASTSVTVVVPDPLLAICSTSPILCNGDYSTATVSAVGGTPPYTGAGALSLLAGVHTLLIVDNNGCTTTINVTIQEPAALTATVVSNDPSCIGNNDGSIEINTLGGTEPYTFNWNNNLMIVPVISGLIEGFYSLNISDVNNCELSLGTVALNDIQMDCIKIPNAFTPNSDAVNDTWDIENIDIFPWADIYVYNRWGQQIYYAKPTEPPWDGRFNGDYVPTGTYLYVIQLYNQTKPYTGTVSVVY